jgi:hypothetical protein
MTTHFSDGIAVGTAGYAPNPNNPGLLGRGSSFATAGPGVAASPTVIYRLAALPTASSTNLSAANTSRVRLLSR